MDRFQIVRCTILQRPGGVDDHLCIPKDTAPFVWQDFRYVADHPTARRIRGLGRPP
jgi:hypothetical protein